MHKASRGLTIEQRLIRLSEMDTETGCRVWTGAVVASERGSSNAASRVVAYGLPFAMR